MQPTNTHFNRFDRATRGLSNDRPPIWFMRQAGRYLPEYREVRQQHSFDAMLADAEIATRITLQPMQRFDLDAAVIFADIMTILLGLNIPFNFSGGGPVLEFDISSENELAKLHPERLVDNQQRYDAFLAAIRATRAALAPEKSVIGFAASPFTLVSYLIEGQTSKTHNQTRALMYSRPDFFHRLMSNVAACTVEYLKLQIDAGVSAVQLFESWGDVLSGEAYERLVFPHVRSIIEKITPIAPVIFYDKGASLHYRQLHPYLVKSPCMYSVDWRVAIQDLSDIKLQGNLDPAVLESNAETTRAESLKILRARGEKPGYIFNLGHGITPQAKLECVEAMVSAVQNYRP